MCAHRPMVRILVSRRLLARIHNRINNCVYDIPALNNNPASTINNPVPNNNPASTINNPVPNDNPARMHNPTPIGNRYALGGP